MWEATGNADFSSCSRSSLLGYDYEQERGKQDLRGSGSYLPSTIHFLARVVKWQTRTFEGRMPQGMGVQVPPRAPTAAAWRNVQRSILDLDFRPMAGQTFCFPIGGASTIIRNAGDSFARANNCRLRQCLNHGRGI
jgi:hypothetical protein